MLGHGDLWSHSAPLLLPCSVLLSEARGQGQDSSLSGVHLECLDNLDHSLSLMPTVRRVA